MFSRDYRNFLRNESAQAGREITPDVARKMGLGSVAFDRILNRTALDNVVNDFGLTVSDADVSGRIRGMSVFNGPLGTFDKNTFDRTLAQRGFAEQDFVNGIRSDMTRDQLVGPVEDGLQIPTGYAHALFAYSTELRASEYVVLTPQSLGTVAPPSDAVLAAYVKAHSDRFSTPEYRNVTIALAGPEDVVPTIKVTDVQLHAEYDSRKETYVVPEKRDVYQISFPDEASAKAARAKIDGGMTFDAAAKAWGKSIDNRGSVSQDDSGSQRRAKMFALPLNGVSGRDRQEELLQLGSAMRVSKITPGKTTTFDPSQT